MIRYEKEVTDYLKLPSIPLKEWDGKRNFEKGVAVVENTYGEESYAVCTFGENDDKPSVTKVFGVEPFKGILRVFVVPDYMATEEDVRDMDLDEESLKNAKKIVNEADELSASDDSDDSELSNPDNEYYFDHIHTDEEAEAFIRSYNKTNRIDKNKVPKTHEGLVLRLAAIYSELNKKR